MKPNDRPKFLEIVLGFAELKGKQLSAPALELYWRAMQSWSITEFAAAAEQLLRTREFMPVPKDFEDLRKAGRMTPGEAFARAMEIARDCSPYRAASSGNGRIDAAARACGGYFTMGQQQTEKLGFLENRFTEHYETISGAEDVRESLPALTGGPHLEALYNDPKRLS